MLDDSIQRNAGSECSDMKVECFPSITMEQLHRVIENRDLENPDTVFIDVGTNDLRRSGNRDCVMSVVYVVVNTAKQSFQHPE